MNKTVWKPIKEIEYLLRDKSKFTILSCCLCANLSGTGGTPGIKTMKRIIKTLNKKVVKSKNLLVCCEEYIMKQALEKYRKAISKSDALILLCCAGGVKTAFICNPGLPVISPLDPVGSVSVTHKENAVARSICKVCGSCVISYTGGICPISDCPVKSKYGPCKKAPVKGTKCAVDPQRDCVWKEIEKIGNPKELVQLRKIHKARAREDPVQDDSLNNPITYEKRGERAPALKKTLAWFTVRIPFIEKVVGVFR